MAVMPKLPLVDLLPTLAQRRQRDFRRQWRVWAGLALAGVSLTLVPIVWDLHLRRGAKTQLLTLREARQRLDAKVVSFDVAQRALARMRAHRQAALALVARRQDVAGHLLDVIRACADGVRLADVKLDGHQWHVDGYATTQSRVRELQKRLRSLPWVKKVSEVESSLIPEGVAHQLVGANPPSSLPAIRRFALRVEDRPAAASALTADEMWDQEEPLDDQ
ncbi:hypothetical protein PPN31114_05179 [Pandoraea pneumonica]|jgi:Tfp pilus assembly protein PilN|uniref:Fimbrial assembly protein n=1 Tax=Pandoraea pneumonica TaxID=2508299 RepID=A0A5E4Z964_9BURK|nr:PilN domain-containing protein [Pandoraea pneumonica]VVE57212.1 hypothetical protein PPN31114_05179 [Pandoraea pneumonica]